jgi:hypothetical protein
LVGDLSEVALQKQKHLLRPVDTGSLIQID